MRKLTGITIILTILLSAILSSSAAGITVKVNGQAVAFPDAQPYINSDSRTMVPVRFVSQALGATVEWDNANQTVKINTGKKITLKIGERRAFVDGEEKTFDTSAVLKEDRTFVPLRFVSETLGATAEWVSASQTVLISTELNEAQKLLKPKIVSGEYIIKNGYYMPAKSPTVTGLGIGDSLDSPDPDGRWELDAAVEMAYLDKSKTLEGQYAELRNILRTKFSEETVNTVLGYMQSKTDIKKELPLKDFILEGKLFSIDSGAYSGMINLYIR